MKNIETTLTNQLKKGELAGNPVIVDFTGYGEQLKMIGANEHQIRKSIAYVSECFNMLLNLAFQDVVKQVNKKQKLN